MDSAPVFDPRVLDLLTPEERTKFYGLLARSRRVWSPLKGPQTTACVSEATVLGFGGAAGGGKSDLGIGLSLTEHRTTGFCRVNGTELLAVKNRYEEIVGPDSVSKDGVSWTRPDGARISVEFMSFPDPGDVQKYRGRPHDLLVFDEASNMRLADVRFLMGWLRTTIPGQRCRVLMTFNPPDTVEGRWVVHYFAPWLDKKHPRPALPGEIRWFAVIDGADAELPTGNSFLHKGEMIFPQSRTFVPSRIADNPFLMQTNYLSTLQSMEEPHRSRLLYGDFHAGVQDEPGQVIPTEWIEAAMARWRPLDRKPLMDSLGADVARGGNDRSVLFPRYGMWFDEPIVIPGTATPDGPSFAAHVVRYLRDGATVHIDVIGVGSSPYDHLRQIGVHVIGVDVSTKAMGTDKSGRMRFLNTRALLWWKAREAFDPANNTGIAVPPNRELLAELAAMKWKAPNGVVQMTPRDELVTTLGRSPDLASAFVLALMDTPPIRELPRIYNLDSGGFDYDPLKNF